jgi:hypothetical protein
MNLLSSVDWRAEDRRARLLPGYLPATEVLRIVEQQQLLPDVTGYDLEDDPRLADEIAPCVLWVGEDPNINDLEHLDPSPPHEELPPTWREVHQLEEGRCLTLPGERLHDRTLSFWQETSYDPRPAVVSLILDQADRIAGLARWRRKKCVELPQADRTCLGGDARCRCEVRKGLSGRVVIDRCKCTRP